MPDLSSPKGPTPILYFIGKMKCHHSVEHNAAATGVTNFAAGILIVRTFPSKEFEANNQLARAGSLKKTPTQGVCVAVGGGGVSYMVLCAEYVPLQQ